jgi:RNA polymerase sigma-70 factor (ECF subfamily)
MKMFFPGVIGGSLIANDRLLDELRPRAFAIAYRMLGSVADAEDVVQEALLRVHDAMEAGERIESPTAYVSTITTRLAIDELRSARVRREKYYGEWLPEPLVGGHDDETSRNAEMANSLSLAFLILLESLSPEQRAALLLRDVFDYEYHEVAAVIGTTEANARQLTARARRHVTERRPRFEASREQRDELARRFYAAAREGDLAGIEALLAEDVVMRADGGGKVPTLVRPVYGRDRVARRMAAWFSRVSQIPGVELRSVEVNGQPGGMTLDENGGLVGVWALDIADGRIQSMTLIANPDKLRHIGPVGDVRALRARMGPIPTDEIEAEEENQ